MKTQLIERRRAGRGFRYTTDRGLVTDKQELERFKKLRIPPAWQGVTIAADAEAQVQAIGTDAAGRKQYIYHADFRAAQEQAKFERILRFARALPHMRKVTAGHLRHRSLDREKVLACVVRLMDEAYFRVGNDTYAREHHSYGITTIRRKHTTITGDTILFDYTGKSGQHQVKKVHDRSLARIVRQLDDLPGYEVFKYYGDDGALVDVKSDDVNAYIKDIMGDEFSAKDFRTWGGTLLATAELATVERPTSERERKKAVTVCVKKVARRLGNTPAVCRSSYIDPRVIAAFVDTDDLSAIRETIEDIEDDDQLSPDERCVLGLLEKAKA